MRRENTPFAREQRHTQHPSAQDWSQVWNAFPFDREPTGNIPIPDSVLPRDGRGGMIEITAAHGPEIHRLHAYVWGEDQGQALAQRWDWLTERNPHRAPGEMIGAAWEKSGEIRAYQLMLPQVFRVHGRRWRIYQVGALTARKDSQAEMMRMWRKSRWWPIACWGMSSYAFSMLRHFYRHEDYRRYPDADFPPELFGPQDADASAPCFVWWQNPRSLVRPMDISRHLPIPGVSDLANGVLRLADRYLLRNASGVGHRLTELDRFPVDRAQEFDTLMDGYPFLLERSVDYLNWRYVDRLATTSRCFLLDGPDGDLKAWAVVEAGQDGRGHLSWDLHDYLVRSGDVDSFRSLLIELLRAGREAGAKTVKVMAPTSAGLRRTCHRLGFIPRPLDDRWLFLWRVPHGISLAEVSDLANWHLTSGDVDPSVI